MKKGFTIVELMMVIGIIAVLMGIITTAASTSIKSSRSRRADVLCSLVQTGLATYYEQKGEWPVSISATGNQADGAGNNKNPDSIELSAEQVRTCVKKLIDEAKQNNPMMDISGLFVSRVDYDPVNKWEKCECGVSGCGDRRYPPSRVFGLDFWPAIKGVRDKSPNKMKTEQMYFGYPHPADGSFIRFGMNYSISADSITVFQWHWPD